MLIDIDYGAHEGVVCNAFDCTKNENALLIRISSRKLWFIYEIINGSFTPIEKIRLVQFRVKQ